MLERARAVLKPELREKFYIISGAVISFLTSWGILEAEEGQQWAALIVAAVTLLFASLYSTSSVRTALYVLLNAIQGVAGLYAVLEEQPWGAPISLAATLLGVGLAAAKTPTRISNGRLVAGID